MGDFNGDGSHDVVLSFIRFTPLGEPRAGVVIYYGRGNGTFDAPHLVESRHDEMLWGNVTAGDLNSDGLDDFVTTFGLVWPDATPQFSIWMSS